MPREESLEEKSIIYANLMTFADQDCVCNMDEFFFYPVLRDKKDAEMQLIITLNTFLEYHKRHDFKEARKEDELYYYNGECFQFYDLTINDIYWQFNMPHWQDLEEEQKKEAKMLAEYLKKWLDKMGLDYKFFVPGM